MVAVGLPLPSDTVVDGSADIAVRTIQTVRIQLNYDPVDAFAEHFQILYNGSVVLDTGLVTASGSRVVNVAGADGLITVRVVQSIPDDNSLQNFSWDLIATFVVE